MKADNGIIHFGNFLRWKFKEAGGIAYACRRAELSVKNAERYCRAAVPEPLNIRQENKDRLAVATGYCLTTKDGVIYKDVYARKFADWPALDAAWRATPMAPFPVKQAASKTSSKLTLGSLVEAAMRLPPSDRLAVVDALQVSPRIVGKIAPVLTGKAAVADALRAVRVLTIKQMEDLGARLTREAAEAIARGSRIMDQRGPSLAARGPGDDPDEDE